MTRILITLGAALGLTLSAHAGLRIRMQSPDYSAINDFLEQRAEAQYEQQVQDQLDAQSAAIQAQIDAQNEYNAQ